MAQTIKVPAPPSFDLGNAVCSYGFFMLSPNNWLKRDGEAAFERPLHTLHSGAVHTRITQDATDAADGVPALTVTAASPTPLCKEELDDLQRQVVRMLRLSEPDIEAVSAFRRMHAEAAADGFGHMLRSPSLWEDMVKSITLCNCGWGRTLSMNAALCKQLGGDAFPTPAQVAAAGPEALRACGLGYRGKTICGLAQQMLDGTVDSLELEASALGSDELQRALLRLSGLGPFTAANVLQLLGRFDRIPADTETARHLAKAHGRAGLTPRNLQEAAQKVYERYAPYQFLGYWYELRRDYDAMFGSLVDMDPADYAKATGHNLRVHHAATSKAAKQPAAAVDEQLAEPCTSSNGPLLAMSVPTPAQKERKRLRRVSKETLADAVQASAACSAALQCVDDAAIASIGPITRSRARVTLL